MDEREKNLPKWAQELINHLRLRIASVSEPLVKELSCLRPKVELLQRKIDALEELITCASKGGHATSQAIIEVFQSHSLTLSKD